MDLTRCFLGCLPALTVYDFIWLNEIKVIECYMDSRDYDVGEDDKRRQVGWRSASVYPQSHSLHQDSHHCILCWGCEQGVIFHNLVIWCYSFSTTYSRFVWLFLTPFTHAHTHTHTHTHKDIQYLTDDSRIKMYAVIFHYGYIITTFYKAIVANVGFYDFSFRLCVWVFM